MSSVRLLKSQLPADFEEQVETHRQTLLKHRSLRGVAAPTAHPLIEQCIRRVHHPVNSKKPDDFVTDYVILDDTPPKTEPKPLTLQEKKDNLTNKLLLAEQSVIREISPPNKSRLWSIQQTDIIGRGGPQSPDEEKFIAECTARQVKLDSLHRNVALLLSEIEDLTDAIVDAWVLPESYK